jgi:hypothetical protein
VYHLRHLTMVMAGVDKVGTVVSLSIPILAAHVVLFDRVGAPEPTVAGSTPAPVPAGNLTQVSARR